MMTAHRVTFISTVLNEGESIRRLMDSLAAQTRPPDEVVIVDGGSRDDTAAILHEYADRLPLRVIVRPGANISMSLNGDNEKELSSYFEKLSAGGMVAMPLEKAPWGDTFGMCTDRFGVNWMVNITGQAGP